MERILTQAPSSTASSSSPSSSFSGCSKVLPVLLGLAACNILFSSRETSILLSSSSSYSTSSAHGSDRNVRASTGIPLLDDTSVTQAVPFREERCRTLENMYNQTTVFQNGTADSKLGYFLHPHVLSVYPELNSSFWNQSASNGIKMGTPSLTKYHDTVILGLRLEVPRGDDFRKQKNFLMLCTLTGDVGRVGDGNIQCQDSGISNDYIPPECDASYWMTPKKRFYFGFTTTGPEDARLYMLNNGTTLVATFGMRGCHDMDTLYNTTTPSYSIYMTRWSKSDGSWQLNGPPTLFDLRAPDGTSLKTAYPGVTKNWILLPSTSNDEIRLSYGWSNNMTQHYIYTTNGSTMLDSHRTSLPVIPYNPHNNITIPKTVGEFRGSTNFILWPGSEGKLSLALGHRHYTKVERIVGPRRKNGKKNKNVHYYHHYWYIICSDMPHQHVFHSQDFRFTLNNPTSFALGLAQEGAYFYVSASERDRRSMLLRYTVQDVEQALFGNASSPKTDGGLPHAKSRLLEVPCGHKSWRTICVT